MKIGLSNPNLINTRTYRQDILCHTDNTDFLSSSGLLFTTTITTITTPNGDTVAKGRVVLVVIVVLVVVNSMFLSLTLSVPIRVHPMLLNNLCYP